MDVKKPPTLEEGPSSPKASSPLAGDWLHDIKQWYFTGSRRSAQERHPVRFVASRTVEAPAENVEPEVGGRRPE